LRYQ